MDEYENLVVAVAMIDAAIRALEEAENQDQVVEYLHETRNRLNDDRIVCLGNGRGRPFWAADRIEELEAENKRLRLEVAHANDTADAAIEGTKEIEAKLDEAVGALEKVQAFVQDLEPYADQGNTLVPALYYACTILTELKEEDDE